MEITNVRFEWRLRSRFVVFGGTLDETVVRKSTIVTGIARTDVGRNDRPTHTDVYTVGGNGRRGRSVQGQVL
jgi:hypothetical protein